MSTNKPDREELEAAHAAFEAGDHESRELTREEVARLAAARGQALCECGQPIDSPECENEHPGVCCDCFDESFGMPESKRLHPNLTGRRPERPPSPRQRRHRQLESEQPDTE